MILLVDFLICFLFLLNIDLRIVLITLFSNWSSIRSWKIIERTSGRGRLRQGLWIWNWKSCRVFSFVYVLLFLIIFILYLFMHSNNIIIIILILFNFGINIFLILFSFYNIFVNKFIYILFINVLIHKQWMIFNLTPIKSCFFINLKTWYYELFTFFRNFDIFWKLQEIFLN